MPALVRRSRLPRAGAAALVAAIAVLGVAAPAHADPGDATAVAVSTDLVLTPADSGTPGAVLETLGATSAPANESASLPTATIQADLGTALGGVNDVLFFDALTSSSTSDSSGVTASASVGSMRIDTVSGPLVITGVSALAECFRGGGLSSSTTGASVTLDGSPVTLDPSGTTVIDLSSGLGSFVITLTAGQATTGSGTARAVGFVVQVSEDLPGLLAAEGTVTLAQAECASLPTTTTTGTIRAAENGAPLPDVCIVWSPASDPGANTVQWSNGNGTFSIETDEPGPIDIGFFVPENDYDCYGAIGAERVPSWLDGLALSGATGMDAVAPIGAQHVAPGTEGIVACLGTAGPVASADCVTPDVTLSGRVVGLDGSPVTACVFVLGDASVAIGPFVTAPDGTWTVPELPRDTEFAVAFLPYYEGEYGACADDGPPPAPGPGELQPVFFGNVWIDFTDGSLFEDPREWGIVHGATLVSGTTSDIIGCLSAAPGDQVPRPECLTTLASTGPEVATGIAVGIALASLGGVLLGAGMRPGSRNRVRFVRSDEFRTLPR